MNKTFKVARSLTRGTVVTSEKASSYQGKAVKTVIAAAVASLVAGAAMAASNPVTITGSLELSGSTYTATGVKVGADDNAVDWKKDTDSLGTDSVVTLDGGQLAVKNAETTVSNIVVKNNGSIILEATTAAAGLTDSVSKNTSYDKLDISLTSTHGKTASNATLTLNGTFDRTFKSGTLTTAYGEAKDTTDKAKNSISSEGNLIFGTPNIKMDSQTGNGTVIQEGTAYDFAIGADTDVKGANVSLVNGQVKVDSGATFSVIASTADTGTVTVGEDVSFANAGTVALSGAQVAFNADYEADKNAGKLTLNGATTIAGSITGGEVRVGSAFKLNDKNEVADTASVLLNGTTDIAKDGKVDATKLTFADGAEALTVEGNLNAAETSVEVSGAAISNASYTTDDGSTKYGTFKLGVLTIENIASKDKASAASLTLKNSDAENAVVIDSVTINAATEVGKDPAKEPATYAGSLSLQTNDFEIGRLSNHGTVTVETAGKTLSITKAGDSANAGSITGSGNVAVGEGVVLTNTGLIGFDAASADKLGKLEVTGTVTNVNTAASSDGKTPAVTGKITNVAEVVVADGGVLDTDFVSADTNAPEVTYKADKTTLNEGGTLKTSLNARTDTENSEVKTALALNGAYVIAGGAIVDRNDKVVTDYVIGDNASLTVEADNTFGTVQVKGSATVGQLNISDAVAKVSDLQLSESGSVTLDDGASLEVTKLSTAANTSKLTVTDGTVTTTLAGLGLQVKEKAVAEKTQTAQVNSQTIDLAQNGTLVLSDYQSATSAEALTGKDALKVLQDKLDTNFKGVVDLGNVDLGYKANDDDRYDYANLEHGFATTALKQASVEGITSSTNVANTLDHSESFGNVYTGDTATAKTLTVDGATLTLNQASKDGFLVWHEETVNKVTSAKASDVAFTNAGKLVVNAEKGTVGSVTGNTGALAVTSAADLTVDGDVDVASLEVDGALTQTASTADTTYSIKAKALTVTGVLNASANDLTITRDTPVRYFDGKDFHEVDTVAGTASVKNLTTNSDLLVTGELTVADTLTGANGYTVYVGNNDAAGTLVVKTLDDNTTVFADPGFDVKPSLVVIEAADTTITGNTASTSALAVAGRNSVVSLGTADKTEAMTVFGKSGYVLADTPATGDNKVNAYETKTVNSVLYVNGSKTYLGAAAAAADTVESFASINYDNEVYVATNSLLALDANTVDATGERAVFDKNVYLEDGSILFVDNLKNGQKIKLSEGALENFNGAVTAFEGDILMDFDQIRNAQGDRTNVLAVTMVGKDYLASVGLDSSVAGFDAAYSLFETGANVDNNSKSALFNKWLYTTASSPAWQKFSDGEYDVNGSTIKSIANAAGALGATTGVQTMTMDAVNQMADTVADRTSVLTQRGQGVNVWADVNGGKFEAKTLFDGAGYSSDIYSGVLGLDYQFSCNAVLGAALTIGTADTDSKNSAFKASTDSDLVGFSVYASKTFADIWNVSADIGYLQASNEVKADGYGFNYKFDQDTDAFTVGVRGEVLTKAGSVNIVPHVGLRYTALSTDGFEAAYVTDIDDQNIFQMPVGVTVSADFETSGWTIAPKFDLSVVPTFGDKDADLKLGVTGASATSDYAVRVIDSNPVQAQLGINATNGAWGFGLNYKLGVGSDDRMNNSFNANVRYAF